MRANGTVVIEPVTGLPLVRPGDDLAQLLVDGLRRLPLPVTADDVLVVAQKAVSKAEGRLVDLRDVQPSPRALDLAAEVDKDPRLVEVILRESTRVVRAAPGVLITEVRQGFVCANAGVDQSNVEGDTMVALLPEDGDVSAETLREAIGARLQVAPAVIISDSHGRPWRLGTVGVAIGAAGIEAVEDLRGAPDLFGRPLRVSSIGRVDELAATAALVMGEADEAIPAALIRGASWLTSAEEQATRSLVRPPARDLFR